MLATCRRGHLGFEADDDLAVEAPQQASRCVAVDGWRTARQELSGDGFFGVDEIVVRGSSEVKGITRCSEMLRRADGFPQRRRRKWSYTRASQMNSGLTNAMKMHSLPQMSNAQQLLAKDCQPGIFRWTCHFIADSFLLCNDFAASSSVNLRALMFFATGYTVLSGYISRRTLEVYLH